MYYTHIYTYIHKQIASAYQQGIPTTRALCCITSDSRVERDILYNGNPIMERCSVVCRLAPTFWRFGTFQICSQTNALTGACIAVADHRIALTVCTVLTALLRIQRVDVPVVHCPGPCLVQHVPTVCSHTTPHTTPLTHHPSHTTPHTPTPHTPPPHTPPPRQVGLVLLPVAPLSYSRP